MGSYSAISDGQTIQQTGSYRAWSLPDTHNSAIDLAWHTKVGHECLEQHTLLPFTEPSLALRRRFDQSGYTTDWDFVIFKAQPDGGAYAPAAGEELFALRLAPEWMEGALRLSPRDHIDDDTEVPQFLLAFLDGAARLADQGQFIDAWCATAELLSRSITDTDRIGHAVAMARKSAGVLAPAELAREAGVSARHMRRSFVDRFGLTPRAMVRRQRLTMAMLDAERSEHPNWADLAAAYRFSDQAHMIRECRALTGASPVTWHTQRRAMAVSFNT